MRTCRLTERPPVAIYLFRILFLLALLISCITLVGCDEEVESEDARTHVTVSVWDYSVISSGFANYINSLNPDYDIEWLVGDDSLDFYQYQAEEGSLPDVILVKGFNPTTSVTLSDSLYDLGNSDLIDDYQEVYLAQIPGNEDTITYLPGDAGFEGIVINEYLFDLYDISVPSDRESFLQACQAFAEHDVRGFVAGMSDAETCYEVMQGFADESLVSQTEDLVSQLLQRDSATIAIDSSAFDDSLSYVNSLIEAKVIQKSDMDLSPEEAESAFVNGEAAMYFLSSGNASSFGEKHNMTVRAIPFFGSSSSWAVAEPVFLGMVSNVQSEGVSTASDENLRGDALTVLESIMSDDAQAYYRSLYDIDAFITPGSDKIEELSSTLEPLETCLDQDDVRLYLPNKETTKALGATVRDLVLGDLDSEEALNASTELLQLEQTKDTSEIVAFSEGVSCLFDTARGNVAASDIAQVVAAQTDSDFFISSPLTARCPLYAGSKTKTELAYAVAPTNVYTATLTGSEIEELVANAVSASPTPYTLPVVSGLHIEVEQSDDGYELASIERITASEASESNTESSSNSTTANEGRIETVPLDSEASYRVSLSCYENETLFGAIDDYGFIQLENTLQSLWIKAFKDETVTGLPAYQDYFAFTED